MPKSKNPNNAAEGKKTVWRTPVKLPSIAAVEPMKSLYAPNSGAVQSASVVKDGAAKIDLQNSASEDAEQEKTNQPQGSSDLAFLSPVGDQKNSPTSSQKRNTNTESTLSGKPIEAEDESVQIGEADFLKLLRSEKMDFYSLAEILRGSSMALYCVLFSESLAKGENRCQIRQNELMMRARINNPATFYKQERWLTALHLINKSVRLGSHNGASYEVRPLKTLPLPHHILDQFDGYLTELVK